VAPPPPTASTASELSSAAPATGALAKSPCLFALQDKVARGYRRQWGSRCLVSPSSHRRGRFGHPTMSRFPPALEEPRRTNHHAGIRTPPELRSMEHHRSHPTRYAGLAANHGLPLSSRAPIAVALAVFHRELGTLLLGASRTPPEWMTTSTIWPSRVVRRPQLAHRARSAHAISKPLSDPRPAHIPNRPGRGTFLLWSLPLPQGPKDPPLGRSGPSASSAAKISRVLNELDFLVHAQKDRLGRDAQPVL
jgi:hypothetical protein